MNLKVSECHNCVIIIYEHEEDQGSKRNVLMNILCYQFLGNKTMYIRGSDKAHIIREVYM